MVDLNEARVRDVATNVLIPELFKNRQQYTALRLKRSAHTHVTSHSLCNG